MNKNVCRDELSIDEGWAQLFCYLRRHSLTIMFRKIILTSCILSNWSKIKTKKILRTRVMYVGMLNSENNTKIFFTRTLGYLDVKALTYATFLSVREQSRIGLFQVNSFLHKSQEREHTMCLLWSFFYKYLFWHMCRISVPSLLIYKDRILKKDYLLTSTPVLR